MDCDCGRENHTGLNCGVPLPTHRSAKSKAHGTHVAGEMNRTEQAYADYLGLRTLTGEVRAYLFETVKFRLAKDTHFTPDFAVILADGTLEFHEVKGTRRGKYFATDDAKVKIKIAAKLLPWKFFLVWKQANGEWAQDEVGK
jgi:hypothetical protein